MGAFAIFFRGIRVKVAGSFIGTTEDFCVVTHPVPVCISGAISAALSQGVQFCTTPIVQHRTGIIRATAGVGTSSVSVTSMPSSASQTPLALVSGQGVTAALEAKAVALAGTEIAATRPEVLPIGIGQCIPPGRRVMHAVSKRSATVNV